MKKAAVFVWALAVITAGAMVWAQDARSVEESYTQESVVDTIIGEMTRSDSREMQMSALEYIKDAIDSGTVSKKVMSSLDYLATEGLLNKTRENGRVVNNFPDVRRESAKLLGALGNSEAKELLIKMVLIDNEPMVLQEAIKSLGDIGNDESGEAVSAIAWVINRFDVLNPDNIMAISAIDAFEKLGGKDGSVIRALMKIEKGRYTPGVQSRAAAARKSLLVAKK